MYRVQHIENFKQIVKLFVSVESIELRCQNNTTISIQTMLLSNASSIRVELKASNDTESILGIPTNPEPHDIVVCLNIKALLIGIENVMKAYHITYYTFTVAQDMFVIQAYDKTDTAVSISTVRGVERTDTNIEGGTSGDPTNPYGIEFQNVLGLSLDMVLSGLSVGGKENIRVCLKPLVMEFEVADTLVSSKISFPIRGDITTNYSGAFVKPVKDLMKQFVKCVMLVTKLSTKKRKLVCDTAKILVRTHIDGPLNLAYSSDCIHMSIFSGPIQE